MTDINKKYDIILKLRIRSQQMWFTDPEDNILCGLAADAIEDLIWKLSWFNVDPNEDNKTFMLKHLQGDDDENMGSNV